MNNKTKKIINFKKYSNSFLFEKRKKDFELKQKELMH